MCRMIFEKFCVPGGGGAPTGVPRPAVRVYQLKDIVELGTQPKFGDDPLSRSRDMADQNSWQKKNKQKGN